MAHYALLKCILKLSTVRFYGVFCEVIAVYRERRKSSEEKDDFMLISNYFLTPIIVWMKMMMVEAI